MLWIREVSNHNTSVEQSKAKWLQWPSDQHRDDTRVSILVILEENYTSGYLNPKDNSSDEAVPVSEENQLSSQYTGDL